MIDSEKKNRLESYDILRYREVLALLMCAVSLETLSQRPAAASVGRISLLRVLKFLRLENIARGG